MKDAQITCVQQCLDRTAPKTKLGAVKKKTGPKPIPNKPPPFKATKKSYIWRGRRYVVYVRSGGGYFINVTDPTTGRRVRKTLSEKR